MQQATDFTWINTSMIMILLMQAGFALIESGTVRKKNASSILVKNIYNIMAGGFIYWLVGYGFSYGSPDMFIGKDPEVFTTHFFHQFDANMYPNYIYYFALAITCSVVPHGALAERT